ncbi:MAG TPA: branched-chain amino acid ABC transporter permease [Solirubrobacterales bacterium]|nr:branched-chain amino acid ABC transporter permease [Solirubrobacterales bacterium]
MAARPEYSPRERLLGWSRDRPALAAGAVLALGVLALVAAKGVHDVAQTALYGLSLGSIYALGAVGLTLVYGILKLVNFAHGDLLTFGAYMAYLANISIGLPVAVALLCALIATAALAVLFELTMWRPMRGKGAGLFQLMLMSIGLAFLIRSVVQFIWGGQVKELDVDTTSTVQFLGLRIGETELVVIIIGFVVLSAIGLMLRLSTLGKQMRAVSDDLDLAETAGIDTRRVIILTWVFAGALAGLAGVLAGATQTVEPNLGFELLLAIFAAVILGGIGDAFGALAAGIVLGLVIELSTLVFDAQWKLVVGFVVLILALIIRPQGIFGKAKAI